MLVAALHFRPEHRAVAPNAERLLTLLETALRRGRASLVVTPELALSGFAFATPDEMRPYAQPTAGPFGHALASLSRQHSATIVAGIAEQGDDGLLYNAALVATNDGNLLTVRAPRYAHNYGWMTGFDDGDANVFMSTSLGKLRVALCAGLLSLPDSPTPGVIAVPASWNDEPPGSCLPLWQSLARKHGSVLVTANRYGREEYSTGADCDFRQAISCIIDCDGRILAHSHEEQHDAILLADLPPPRPHADVR